ncbi:MAG TPA: hypothetical protein VJG90_07140 [Candidatus Nanoarchaeia archaeon]|nr:hypothetical protein [Candidatus Nanoarchaeia archaeon]
MSDSVKLYNLLTYWIQNAETLLKERATYLRGKFGDLEKRVFGTEVSVRVQNPLAMLYDRARNSLVHYASYKDSSLEGLTDEVAAARNPYKLLQNAQEAFSKIPQPLRIGKENKIKI